MHLPTAIRPPLYHYKTVVASFVGINVLLPDSRIDGQRRQQRHDFLLCVNNCSQGRTSEWTLKDIEEAEGVEDRRSEERILLKLDIGESALISI